MHRRTKRLALAAILVIAVAPFILGYEWWRPHYPYGMSHCCDLGLSLVLRNYAEMHDGAFPTGQATPEASLSLLYREKTNGDPLADADLLRGRTVPESVVKEILERGEPLTPETCGWYYVDGLRLDDDYRLALFWDKIGLDHNGGRMADEGHTVLFVSGNRKFIPETEWDAFMEEQKKLLAERKTAIHHDAKLQIDNREVNVQVRVVGDDICGSTWYSMEPIATLKKMELGLQGLPIIPLEEIKNAKVVVEKDKSRVRFVLKGREIVYDGTAFHIEASSGSLRKE